MTTNALEVDTTQFMLEVLAPANLARVCTELPADLEASLAALPVLQVVRVGGGNDRLVIDNPTFVLHGFAPAVPAGQKVANMLLQRAFTTLVAATGRVIPVDGGRAILVRVDLVGGPAWAPYVNTNARHAVSTVRAFIKIA